MISGRSISRRAISTITDNLRRITEVFSECHAVKVPFESRTVKVPKESKKAAVPFESRTVRVPFESRKVKVTC